ncbi:class I SAM-dependent methyltransferase [Paenibacillus sp. 1P07SE]|uniref:class I SAM-dependent methyltransferase n=1 Tax=Paenibacillus sp. 1P07SE TaxID=3132209 RepID=UPI0039A6B587
MEKADNWERALISAIEQQSLRQATLSQLRSKSGGHPPKTIIRPVQLKQGFRYQFEYHEPGRVTHDNLEPEAAAQLAVRLLQEQYRQALIKTEAADLQLLFSKKGKPALLRKPPTAASSEAQDHDRKKQRVLDAEAPAPFLVELGILSPAGRVLAQKQDKYRQINRFLEMVLDVADELPQDRTVTIVDFGCGKSYLTFALYHLLAIQQQRQIRIIGLDLKADVIAWCEQLARKLNYMNLRFLQGDIARYEELEQADMVVTLHACDTATDAALAKAVSWGASVIMSVPCCQHELLRQVDNEMLEPLLAHGLLKERFSALVTDSVRARLLEVLGYKVQLLEFIDPEHTPKNLLIRAARASGGDRARKWSEYVAFRDGLGIQPYLEKALAGRLPDG